MYENECEQINFFDCFDFDSYLAEISNYDEDKKIKTINDIKKKLNNISPFKDEPVDCVLWVKGDNVGANDYNPNKVAPPEMELLKTSIMHDGYTQPIVTMMNEDNKIEVIDGFHRNRVGKECEEVRKKVKGYLPVVNIRESQNGRNDRIASTIRHNRARGKHQIDAMSEIVIELKKRNWSDVKISKELGMDKDEVLRLCQITGLTDVFSNDDFTKSWEIGDYNKANEIEDFEDIVSDDEKSDRIYHTYEKWECQKNRFYENTPPKGMSKNEAEQKYIELLKDIPEFEKILEKVISEWIYSCEHYLSNENMNRIAWLGQASVCYKYKIPSCFRTGYNYLSEKEKEMADNIALKYLNLWLKNNGFEQIKDLESSKSKTKANLY